ncbi:hypothetical protein JC525_18510 [Alteromonas sp. IB21]|uniref:hypothetical protein n=1 Tax=Alteromonas sp. IB21 TaxID=2779369 RepID=UPI0018E75257|nr:hypothetical protein [Alteromonas sp. IB21]MBJ2130924.1 hypothetical protein [Alteromonas sp. IB21]
MEQEKVIQAGGDNSPASDTNVATAQASFKLLNKFAIAAFICFALGHFLPVVELSSLGVSETVSVADSMSGGQMVLLLFCLTIGIGAAATGIFPLAAKAIAAFFLISYGLHMADAFDETSEIANSLDLMGIDLYKSRGWHKLIKFIGIGAYLLVIGYLMMLVSLVLKSKNRDDAVPAPSINTDAAKQRAQAMVSQSSNGLSSFLTNLNLQVSEIKIALKQHDANNSVTSMKSGVEKVKSAADKKEASSGIDGVFEVIKNLFGYAFGYTSTVFKTNLTGKVIVVVGAFLLYQLIF